MNLPKFISTFSGHEIFGPFTDFFSFFDFLILKKKFNMF